MKLILANNHTPKFTAFYQNLADQSTEKFDYAPYTSLVFMYNSDSEQPLQVLCTATGKRLDEYDGVYINGYLNTYELAATVAIACEALKVPFVNRELQNPPSLSKLSSYAKLAAAGVRVPRTIAGAKVAVLAATGKLDAGMFPAVLKRADADRGVDNFKVGSADEVEEMLREHSDKSLWLLQEFVPNDGFYLVCFYDNDPKFSIFRTLEERPDGNEHKAHMYKPLGGGNASLVPLDTLPDSLLKETTAAIKAMNRQIGSVDCLYDPATDRTYILEVNYNPQLVTIQTFKDARVEAFLNYLSQEW